MARGSPPDKGRDKVNDMAAGRDVPVAIVRDNLVPHAATGPGRVRVPAAAAAGSAGADLRRV
jgi:hypothetical protein